MTIRYCPRCKTDVEDTGGYCLLGHRLALEPPVASLEDLRAEVDRAFEEARVQVAAVSGGNPASPLATNEDVPTAPIAVVASPAAPPVQVAEAPASVSDPVSEPRAPRRMGSPPPPPPPRRVPVDAPPNTNGLRHDVHDVEEVAAPQEVANAQEVARPDVPSAEEVVARHASVWKDLDREVDIVGDPIGAFAPPPHMDWGPDKRKPLKRKPTRRFRRTSDASE